MTMSASPLEAALEELGRAAAVVEALRKVAIAAFFENLRASELLQLDDANMAAFCGRNQVPEAMLHVALTEMRRRCRDAQRLLPGAAA
jgi:hypothetical protein